MDSNDVDPTSVGSKLKSWTRKRRQSRLKKSDRDPVTDERTFLGEERPTVFYESFQGSQVGCSPEAVFVELLNSVETRGFWHVWALTETALASGAHALYRHLPNVAFVRRGSSEYFRLRDESQYLVNNMSFDPGFLKLPNQVYLNTWHGQPLKRMGFDLGSATAAQNTFSNFLQADMLVSSSEYMTQTLYNDAFRLRNLFRGEVLRVGTPRIDRQFASSGSSNEVFKVLQSRGVDIDSSHHNILYAPTWKGASYARPINEAVLLKSRIEALNQRFSSADIRVFLKVHQSVYSKTTEIGGFQGSLVPDDIPTNFSLSAFDGLVTDYSSVFFDFLRTGKPIVFHTADLEGYAAQRGFYLDPADWPGPITRSIEELGSVIAAIGTGCADDPAVSHEKQYRRARERFCGEEDGRASARVVDALLAQAPEADRKNARVLIDGRATVLLTVDEEPSLDGQMLVCAVVEQFDPGSYDLTLLCSEEFPLDFLSGFASPPRVLIDSALARMVAPVESPVELRDYRGIDLSGYFDEYLRVSDFRRLEPVDSGRIQRLAWGASEAPQKLVGRSSSVAYPEDLVGEVGQLLARYDICDIKREVDRVHALSEVVPRRAGSLFVSWGILDASHNHRRLLRAFAKLQGDRPSCSLVIIGEGPNRSWLKRLAHNYEIDSAVTLVGEIDNPYAVMAAADCFVEAGDSTKQSGVLAARVLGLPVVATDSSELRPILPDGVGIRVAPRVDALADGMLAALDGMIPNPPFDHRRHNGLALASVFRRSDRPSR